MFTKIELQLPSHHFSLPLVVSVLYCCAFIQELIDGLHTKPKISLLPVPVRDVSSVSCGRYKWRLYVETMRSSACCLETGRAYPVCITMVIRAVVSLCRMNAHYYYQCPFNHY